MLREVADYIQKRSMPVPETGCWIWLGATSSGYGDVQKWGRHERAHRLSFEAFKGAIPKGCDVCHSCDVRVCCNPDHLFIGTRKDNMQDASQKGRLKGIARKRPKGLIYAKRKMACIICAKFFQGNAKAKYCSQKCKYIAGKK